MRRAVLANGIDAIESARRALLACVGAAGLDPRVVNRLEVVVEEVVSNIVRHGFAPGSSQRIEFSAQLTDTDVILEFADDGDAFDPLGVAAPPKFGTLAEAREGGLGIALVRRLARRVAYTAPAKPGFPVNRLVVEVARDPASLSTRRR